MAAINFYDSRIQHNNIIGQQTVISSPACLLILNFYIALDVPLLDFNVQNNTSVLKKKGNPDRKTFAM